MSALASGEPKLGRWQFDELDRYLSCGATGQPVHTWPAGRDALA
jgi:hypothetical protein